jgi:hypothetical protein
MQMKLFLDSADAWKGIWGARSGVVLSVVVQCQASSVVAAAHSQVDSLRAPDNKWLLWHIVVKAPRAFRGNIAEP